MENKEIIKMFKSAILIKAGDHRVKLGHNSTPPTVDCRVIAEETYQGVLNLLENNFTNYEKQESF